MNSDRARIYAHQLREKLALGKHTIDHIEDLILQACAEQREQDARICEDIARKQSRADSAYAGAVNCAKAIREGK